MATNQPSDNEREPTLADVIRKLDKLLSDVEQFNERFSNYQQATQWVAQPAFPLIASATITVIVTAVLHRQWRSPKTLTGVGDAVSKTQ